MVWNRYGMFKPFKNLSNCSCLTRKSIHCQKFCRLSLDKGKEKEAGGKAGTEMKRNPGYAIDRLRAAVSYQLKQYVITKGI